MDLAKSVGRSPLAAVLTSLVVLLSPVSVWGHDEETGGDGQAAEKSEASKEANSGDVQPADSSSGSAETAGRAKEGVVLPYWLAALAGSIIALGFAFSFYSWMKKQDEGNEKMIEIAQAVRDGADAYLSRQYRVVAIFFVVACALLAVVAFVLDAQHPLVPFAFLTGGLFSGLAGWFGMKTATWASSRNVGAKSWVLTKSVTLRPG